MLWGVGGGSRRWTKAHWRSRTSCMDHKKRRYGALWSSSRPQDLLPAFSLCHFLKMWVSLVNTLNPRPRENRAASCAVRNWRDESNEMSLIALIGFACDDSSLEMSLTKPTDFPQVKPAVRKQTVFSLESCPWTDHWYFKVMLEVSIRIILFCDLAECFYLNAPFTVK